MHFNCDLLWILYLSIYGYPYQLYPYQLYSYQLYPYIHLLNSHINYIQLWSTVNPTLRKPSTCTSRGSCTLNQCSRIQATSSVRIGTITCGGGHKLVMMSMWWWRIGCMFQMAQVLPAFCFIQSLRTQSQGPSTEQKCQGAARIKHGRGHGTVGFVGSLGRKLHGDQHFGPQCIEALPCIFARQNMFQEDWNYEDVFNLPHYKEGIFHPDSKKNISTPTCI